MLGIRFVSRWIFRTVVIVLILAIGAYLLIDPLAQSALERQLKEQTGLGVRIGDFQMELLNKRVTIEKLVLYNTAEFGGGPMLDVPEVHVEYDGSALGKGLLHLKLLRLNVAELHVVVDKEGRNNFDALRDYTEKRKADSGGIGKGDLEFGGIDMLNLTVGKFVKTDLRDPKNSQKIDVDIQNEIIPDIKTKEDLQTKLTPIILQRAATILLQSFLGGKQPKEQGGK